MNIFGKMKVTRNNNIVTIECETSSLAKTLEKTISKLSKSRKVKKIIKQNQEEIQ